MEGLTATEYLPLPVLAVIVAVGVFAIVQSLFGVGLLLFGTPTLLLLGLPFELVLAYLLPSSIVVSALQIATSGGLTLEPIRRQFLVYTAPALVAASACALVLGSPHQVRHIVGVMLLLTAVMRLTPSKASLTSFVRRHLRAFMLGLGIVHGVSNLGGGILTVVVGSCYEDKVSIRRHIAFAYGTMATIQLVVLFVTGMPALYLPLWLLLPVLAGATFLLLGQRVFRGASQGLYQHGLTAIIMSFAVVILSAA